MQLPVEKRTYWVYFPPVMLDDRSYMREPEYERRWSATVVLLMVNAVIFVVQEIVVRYLHFPANAYFALSLTGLQHGYVWQLLTFQFMHAGLPHLLLNSLAIYVFGRPLETELGRIPFLKLYFLSGVAGGLLQTLASWLAWVVAGSHIFGTNLVGASAGAFGLVAAYAALYPERPLTILLAFLIPISMRAKFLLLFSALLAVFGILVPSDNVAHTAHLGGMIGGLVYVVWVVRPPNGLIRWPSRQTIEPPRELVHTAVHKRSVWQRSRAQEPDDLPTAEFISREVDPILDKISAHGIQSLTPRERRILEAARNKMDKG
jgi:membrane associated rhomboid family serine protease